MQAQVSSGGGRALLLIKRQSEGFVAEMETKVKISGSETSVGLAKLDQTEVERGRRAAEHLQRDASIGMLGMGER